MRAALCGLAILLVSVCSAPALAGEERYDYDALGRLIRVIDEQGRVTEYVYDAAGNLLRVITGGSAQAPAVSSFSPTSIRRGETKLVQINGTGLTGAHVASSDPGLDISGLQASATQIKFTLAATTGAALGAATLSITNAAGSASVAITVNPVLPAMLVDPTPLAIPPDNVPRQITIRLSSADNIDHVIGLSMSNAKVTISPASVTIPAGQLTANATVRGVTAGQSTLTLTSATLGTTLFPVFVTGEFAGISTSYAQSLGVVLQSATPQNQISVSPLASRQLGVVVGNFVRGVAPTNFTVGTGPTTLVISGAGLQTATAVSIVPNTGVTLGAPSVAPDGTSVSVPLTVAANAPISQRRVVVSGSGGAFLAVAPGVDRINVVRTPPQIFSIDPIFAVQGALVGLTIRGANLQDALSVSLTPSAGITVGAGPVASADGSTLSAMVQVTAAATVGNRTVVVTTPGGSSDATPSAANTFAVVNEAVQTVTPINAPALGVVLQDATPPPAQTYGPFVATLGVTLGRVATAISPTVGIVGESPTLTIQGSELQSVTAVQIFPATGVTVGAVSVAPDGLSVSVPLTIAANAPQTVRTVRVLAGSAQVPFAAPDASQFRVSLPLPVLESVTPNFLQTGSGAVMLTVRGRNFQNASSVALSPLGGISINNPPSVDASGTSLTIAVSAATGATSGPRALTVTTPAGTSTATLAAENTVTITTAAGPTISPVSSLPLGVVLEAAAPPANTIDIGPVVSTALGVVLQDGNPPAPTPQTSFAGNVGVVLGTAATSVAPTGFAPNTSGTLTIQGIVLGGTTAVSVVPNTGITLGTFSVAPDGSQVSVPITVATGAPATVREVRLQAGTARIPFVDPAAARITVGPGVPLFDSITPIVAAQGTTFTMTIRGSNFSGATAVTATPPDGIQFSSTFTVNAAGTQLDINMTVAPNAPINSRVIQVLVPGAASSAVAAPANTFSVIAP